MKFERILAIFAHPDDAEWGFSGSVAGWVRDGARVRYVCVTDGAAGSNEPGADIPRLIETRREEQLAACEVLGVEGCAFLGITDGTVEVTTDLRRALTREARGFRPDMIVVPDASRLWDRERGYVNHRDHRMVGEACLALVNPDSPTRPQFPELIGEGFEPFEIPNMWMPVGGEGADTIVDITATIEQKVAALRCHKSQIHDWPVEDWIRQRAKTIGAADGFDYGESFRTFRLKDD